MTLSGMVQMMERLRRSFRGGGVQMPHISTDICHHLPAQWDEHLCAGTLMGHADITVLRQYLALVEEDLQEAHARYGAVDTCCSSDRTRSRGRSAMGDLDEYPSRPSPSRIFEREQFGLANGATHAALILVAVDRERDVDVGMA